MFDGKKVTVVGLARSGVAAANLLFRSGARVTVTDRKGPSELREYVERLDKGITTLLSGHPPEAFAGADMVVVSPGVPLDIPPLREASARGIRVIGELELAFEVAEKACPLAMPAFLAVTGTNGKSTTTSLLYEILMRGGYRVLLGGNIGTALCEELLASSLGGTADFIVTEVSSFQLESVERFRPKGATILNVTPDHLDRYHSMEAYLDAKCRIFLNQSAGDFLVLNADDPLTGLIRQRVEASVTGRGCPRVLHFSRKERVEGSYLEGGFIRFAVSDATAEALGLRGREPTETLALDPAGFRIQGVHNIENVMAAVLVAVLAGCSHEAVLSAVRTFEGLEHRLEFVREFHGVRYINDSKGTNVGAVMKSLEGFQNPVILIAGGRDKDSDFRLLRALVREKVKALVLIGEARDKIRQAVGDLTETFDAGDLESAVGRACALAAPGDVVLLSPACASFDMFRDFEDRGCKYKEAVHKL